MHLARGALPDSRAPFKSSCLDVATGAYLTLLVISPLCAVTQLYGTMLRPPCLGWQRSPAPVALSMWFIIGPVLVSRKSTNSVKPKSKPKAKCSRSPKNDVERLRKRGTGKK
jgi:hypothetical protein